MGLDSVFKFGKYNGLTVEQVLLVDPDYIRWCAENDVTNFDEEVYHELERDN